MSEINPSHAPQMAGFTLIELLVVLIILGLLAGLVVPNLIGQGEVAKQKATVAQISRVSMAVESYYVQHGNPPDRLEELVPEFAKNSQLSDPWGHELHYAFPGEHGAFDLYSFAADNAPGGEKANADANNWD